MIFWNDFPESCVTHICLWFRELHGNLFVEMIFLENLISVTCRHCLRLKGSPKYFPLGKTKTLQTVTLQVKNRARAKSHKKSAHSSRPCSCLPPCTEISQHKKKQLTFHHLQCYHLQYFSFARFWGLSRLFPGFSRFPGIFPICPFLPLFLGVRKRHPPKGHPQILREFHLFCPIPRCRECLCPLSCHHGALCHHVRRRDPGGPSTEVKARCVPRCVARTCVVRPVLRFQCHPKPSLTKPPQPAAKGDRQKGIGNKKKWPKTSKKVTKFGGSCRGATKRGTVA